jgi:hypothetical protein
MSNQGEKFRRKQLPIGLWALTWIVGLWGGLTLIFILGIWFLIVLNDGKLFANQ